MPLPDGCIPTGRFVNLLTREQGYKYRGQAKRTHAYRHPQTYHYVNVPMRDYMAIREVIVILDQMGIKDVSQRDAIIAQLRA